MEPVALEECELLKDSKYRMYGSAVDKALKNFEYSSEWADLISALGKLNKVLTSHTKFPVIPRRIKISKRLAQCMHPALPSGVHLKALETYDIIFKCMGTNRLSQELFIYSAGLFPLLAHAAMNVRPTLLAIYETHFVPLGERLAPGLSGFLNGVLPGLEEGSDYFDRTNSLLESVRNGVTPTVFYTHLWDCISSNSAVRLPAISFILSHFDKHKMMKDQLYCIGADVNIMVKGLCTCFRDISVLVQRSGLDFLLVGFPTHENNLNVTFLQQLLTSALYTVLRRDMSLNRRLFAWLLGAEVNIPLINQASKSSPLLDNSLSQDTNFYFETYSKKLLISAIKIILNGATGQSPHDLQPYRILISLLDKADIGPLILDDILFEVFRLIYLCCEKPGNKAKNYSELLKCSNMLFNSLEPRYLWQYVGVLFSNSCLISHTSTDDVGDSSENVVKSVSSGDPSLLEVCKLIAFLIDTLSLDLYSETLSEHLPDLFYKVVCTLTDNCDALTSHQITTSLQLCLKILSRVRPPLVVHQSDMGYSSLDITDHDLSIGKCKLTEPGKIIQLKSNIIINNKTGNQTTNNESSPRLSRMTDFSSTSTSQSSSGIDLSMDSAEGTLNAANSNLDVDSITSVETLTADISENTNGVLQVASSSETSGMDICLNQYKKFYVTFIYGVLLKIGETKAVFNRFDALRVKSPDATAEERAKHLELLLQAVMSDNIHAKLIDMQDSQQCKIDNDNDGDDKDEDDLNPIKILRNKRIVGLQWTEAVALASKLLLELATFQTSISSTIAEIRENSLRGSFCNDFIPDWLKALVVCSCWLGNTAATLQLTAVSTLLDLALLCRRVDSQVTDTSSQNGVTSVFIVPLLKCDHLKFLEQHTNVFQVIAHWLWEHISVPSLEVKSVELLHQLQSIIHSTDIIENCIGESLLSPCKTITERLYLLRRFTLLWHLGREISNRNCVEDIFYRSMLKILDNLQLDECNPLNLEAQNWLLHSLLRGDINRLLDPILNILLHPSTCRVSVLHSKIQFQNDNTTSPPQPKIYTISSTDGNTIYHISNKFSGKYELLRHMLGLLPTATGQEAMKSSLQLRTKISEMNSDTAECIRTQLQAENTPITINPFSNDYSSISFHSDFDEYLPDVKYSSESKVKKKFPSTNRVLAEKENVTKNNSFPSLENLKNVVLRTPTTLISSSIDIFNLTTSISDSLFPKVSYGVMGTAVEKGRIALSTEGLVPKENELNFQEHTGELVRSYSFSGKNKSEFDCEKPVAAENYFNKRRSSADSIINDMMNEIITSVLKRASNGNKSKETRKTAEEVKIKITDSGSMKKEVVKGVSNVDKNDLLHLHMLLYCGVYDSNKVFYALQTIRTMICNKSRAFLTAAVTTLVPNSNPILELLARHRKSIFARGFHTDIDLSSSTYTKNSMYLEILIITCLYYLRSYYPNFGQSKLTENEIIGNRKIQLSSVELLYEVFHGLCELVRDSGRALSLYLFDLLTRCKVQKVTLHCAYSSVNHDYHNSNNLNFVQDILMFNSENEDNPERVLKHVEMSQNHLARLLSSLIVLEHEISIKMGEPESVVMLPDNAYGLEYISNNRIPQQPMFLATLMKALKSDDRLRHEHHRWISLVISSLPYLKKSLPSIVTSVITQICANIQAVSAAYDMKENAYMEKTRLPPDYMIAQLEALTILTHYCLLEIEQSFNELPLHATFSGGATSHISINLLIHGFSPSFTLTDGNKENLEIQQNARRCVLNSLPKIVDSIAILWQALTSSLHRDNENNAPGNVVVVKNQVIHLLSPIAKHHTINFVISIAAVWKDNISSPTLVGHKQPIIPEASVRQRVLVDLLSSTKDMSVEILVKTIYKIIKQQLITIPESGVFIEVSLLELFAYYVRVSTVVQLSDCWIAFLSLLRESNNLTPPSIFLLFAILNQFLERTTSTKLDKRDQKELQDVIIKLIELCSNIAGACLEQTTWLRRNLAVRDDESPTASVSIKDSDKCSVTGSSHYSVTAQTVLAQFLVPVLKYSFANHEKERVTTLLTSVMINIIPYLRNHTQKNAASFYACSQLLLSVSEQDYMRKAWRKDTMELLLDNSLFQMEARSLALWRTIVDNLMSQDSTSFRDLLNRISMGQGNSLNLFSSREQEYEQKAHLLKRLAFVMLCSEEDQFHKLLPDIQEKLVDSLRLSQPAAPIIQAQVFLCFRVLLLRMSAHHITSLWPIIVTEMVQVMLHIEHDLTTDNDDYRQNSSPEDPGSCTMSPKGQVRHKKRWHRKHKSVENGNKNQRDRSAIQDDTNSHMRVLSALDWPWNSNNGQHAPGNPYWLQLQLATVKLLKLALQLPAEKLPQFQMYRWAFVGTPVKCDVNKNATEDGLKPHYRHKPNEFVPHITRIAHLMDNKFGGPVDALPVVLLPSGCGIRILQDLHPFFSALSQGAPEIINSRTLSELEHEIELDFIEPLVPFR